MTNRIDDLLLNAGTEEATAREDWRAVTDRVPLVDVRYAYPLTFYATSAMSIRMRLNIL